MNPNPQNSGPGLSGLLRLSVGARVASVAGALLLGGGATLWAEREEDHSFSGRSLTVQNLIGEVSVIGHSGSDFEVEVRVRGADSSRYPLRVETEAGSRARLSILVPVDDVRHFVYPEMERSRSSIQVRGYQESGRGWLSELLGNLRGKQVKVSQTGSGEEVWADVQIRVPDGKELVLEHGVGTVSLSDVEADLDVDMSAGEVSGTDLVGDLEVDTGSGEVSLVQVQGDLTVDTGSGGVSIEGFDGDDLSIDTGSGTVDVSRSAAETLSIDTGSGNVHGHSLRLGEATVDTGSGRVELSLLEMGPGDFEIDTGSGSITLLLPDAASASVRADTGSGGVEVDHPSARTVFEDRNEVEFTMGNGSAEVYLDTGSGRITVGQSD